MRKKKSKADPVSYDEILGKINTIRFSPGKTPPRGTLKDFLDWFAEVFLPFLDHQLNSRLSKTSFWIGVTIICALLTLLTLVLPLIPKFIP